MKYENYHLVFDIIYTLRLLNDLHRNVCVLVVEIGSFARPLAAY